ncbi:dihydrofolate reductase [Virgibacillus alimentarius]|uniref:dihydrofolate reductase n=1 Tax=Virgibacillus alimentarius TaxID=698769 RepID=UPI0004933B05|nr:dihydrofolate reductase [Virgibacillus alimentarius]
MISLLVAMDRNHVIGFENGMPWHLPKDLRFFKEKTTGHNVIMGRRTYDSIGKVLPNRRNIVLTRKQYQFPEGIEVINDLKTVLQWNEENPNTEFFIIGGGNIFKQALPFADRMYITWIDESFNGDTYFPDFKEEEWKLSIKEKGEKNPYDYYFLQYDRK